MLKISRREMIIAGTSMVGDKEAESYSATLREGELETVNIGHWINDQELYKENRKECRKDRDEFEDQVYMVQEKMLKEQTK